MKFGQCTNAQWEMNSKCNKHGLHHTELYIYLALLMMYFKVQIRDEKGQS